MASYRGQHGPALLLLAPALRIISIRWVWAWECRECLLPLQGLEPWEWVGADLVHTHTHTHTHPTPRFLILSLLIHRPWVGAAILSLSLILHSSIQWVEEEGEGDKHKHKDKDRDVRQAACG